MLAGSMVAVVTPMDADGKVNYRQFAKVIDFHVDAGTEVLVVAGTTGESATLDHEEHVEVIAKACELAAGRIPIMAGTGSNSTAQTLKLSRGVDRLPIVAFLVVTPYYNKPTQEGLFRHFTAVADAVRVPIILYNVPGRTGCDMLPETIVRLSQHPRIVGVKEATGDLARAEPILAGAPRGFALISGDDPTATQLMKLGACGVISVTANVAPRAMHEVCAAALAGRHAEALSRNEALMPLHRAMFVEANPIPVKWAVERLGLIGPGIRLPLTPLAERYRAEVAAAMNAVGLLPVAA